jgi:hypothetical protein
MGNCEEKRKGLIEERKAAMPKSYRANYDKAVSGNSLRAAINSQCLECVYWHIEDVRSCTDLACPLWKVRPYQDISQNKAGGCSMGRQYDRGGAE